MKIIILFIVWSTAIAASAMESKFLKVGQPMPRLELMTTEGKPFSLQDEAGKQPLVIIFYRGGWCPYCNVHLRRLQEIDPQLSEMGYRILAISPDRPEKLKASTEKGKLSYTLLSDSSMAAARAFGLAFEVDAPMLKKLASYNIDIEEASGEKHHLLPVPAVFIVGRDGIIDFAHANPDYTKRLEPDKVLAAAKKAMAGISKNGFDISNASIPAKEILSGGPPRDGIPSIDEPKFIDPVDADFMQTGDEVLSLSMGGETRAYPLRIIVYHEIVNDEIGGTPVAVTYCPLCGTAMVFSRNIGEHTLDFGVSGLLHQSDVLMYDRKTESLWSQLAMVAVSGSLLDQKLTWIASEQMTWAAWKKQNPKGKVLSTDTGFKRDYSRNAYVGYSKDLNPMFPVPSHRTELKPKDWVIGVVVDGKACAYPIEAFTAQGTLIDGLLKVAYDADTRLASVSRKETGERLPTVKVYWFAWQAFYPDTKVWAAPPSDNGQKDEK